MMAGSAATSGLGMSLHHAGKVYCIIFDSSSLELHMQTCSNHLSWMEGHKITLNKHYINIHKYTSTYICYKPIKNPKDTSEHYGVLSCSISLSGVMAWHDPTSSLAFFEPFVGHDDVTWTLLPWSHFVQFTVASHHQTWLDLDSL